MSGIVEKGVGKLVSGVSRRQLRRFLVDSAINPAPWARKRKENGDRVGE